jgi:hypothetical protein
MKLTTVRRLGILIALLLTLGVAAQGQEKTAAIKSVESVESVESIVREISIELQREFGASGCIRQTCPWIDVLDALIEQDWLANKFSPWQQQAGEQLYERRGSSPVPDPVGGAKIRLAGTAKRALDSLAPNLRNVAARKKVKALLQRILSQNRRAQST